MFHKACEEAELGEGGLVVATIERKRYLVIRPLGGAPRAFRALCPHQEASLAEAPFDGRLLTCPHHGWTFDADGACVSGQRCDPIREVPLAIEAGAVLIDVPEKKKKLRPEAAH